MPNSPIQYYNRYTQQLEQESVYGEPFIRWAYGTPIGKATSKLLLKRSFFSRWYGRRMTTPSSRKKVLPFVQKYSVNMDDFALKAEDYPSFNDFFYRKLKPDARPIHTNDVVFPADGRHMGFQNITDIKNVYVKGQNFDLKTLLNSDSLFERYKNGALVLSRLCPVDYHRFHFPVSGVPSSASLINGPLDSVNPFALRRNLHILSQNKRTITSIQTANFGTVLMIEIGAVCVGSIIQTFVPNTSVRKGDEKGYFQFGGSSTMLLFEPGKIQLASDLTYHTSKGYELFAHMGDSLSAQ